MVSSAMAVLPVWRSPMISSRWPRPIGISASIALRPVAIGSCTDLRGMMPGALTSTRARLVGGDRTLAVDRIAERVDDAAEQFLADRHVDDRAGALDGLAFLDLAVGAEDHDADVVGFEVQRHAARRRSRTRPSRRPGPCRGRRRGRCRRRRDSTWPTSVTSASAPKLAIWLLRIEEISAARISISRPLSCACG